MQGIELEREALDRLPHILADLFDAEPGPNALRPVAPDGGFDATLEDGAGRTWVIEVKGSSSPGVVAAAADRLQRLNIEGTPVLVVPFMTSGGARAAADRRLNWIDLSGNAELRGETFFISVRGRPNRFTSPGRRASPFAPKSSRVSRALLLDPERWWTQKDLSTETDLDPSRISRVVHSLDEKELLERVGARLRPRAPGLLLDAWAEDYRFDRHDIVTGHVSGAGVELARELDHRLTAAWDGHAFTGLAAAWLLDPYARFRLVSVYVEGDPRGAAAAAGVRSEIRGANVQIIGPDDRGVFDGVAQVDDVACVALPQVLLDLGHLPERAAEAAEHLRASKGW